MKLFTHLLTEETLLIYQTTLIGCNSLKLLLTKLN